nr:hypothetical protein [Tanacetum cinerariifolium]
TGTLTQYLCDCLDRIGTPTQYLCGYWIGWVRLTWFIENFSKIAKSLTILTQKCKTFNWSKEQELAFQTLKDKLCNVHVLALLDKPEDFVVYCDAYDYKIRYHPSKANVVANALSKKERVNPKRVRAMNMTIQSSIKDRILAAQKEKWEGIAMDFMIKLHRTSSGHDTIWVIVDRLTKSVHFLPIREDYKMDRLARLYLNEIVASIGVPISTISNRDSRFTSRFWQSVQEALETHLDMKSVVRQLCRLRLEKKSYVDKRRKPLKFSVGDYVLLKVSPWKGVVCFGKKGKLAPRFVGPFEVIEKVGPVAYMLDFPEELDGVYDTFHVSNLKKCLVDPTLQVPLYEIQVDAKLNFVEPVEILKREFKKLKWSRIVIVNVRWNLKRGLNSRGKMGMPTHVCVWSYPNFSALAGRPFSIVASRVSASDEVFLRTVSYFMSYAPTYFTPRIVFTVIRVVIIETTILAITKGFWNPRPAMLRFRSVREIRLSEVPVGAALISLGRGGRGS